MSLENILTPFPPNKPWANVYLNKINGYQLGLTGATGSPFSNKQYLLRTGTTTQSIPDSTPTQVLFGTGLTGLGDNLTYNVDGSVTFNVTALYSFGYSIIYAAGVTGYRTAYINKIGPSAPNYAYNFLGANPTSTTGLTGSAILYIQAGDTYYVGTVQTSGSALNVVQATINITLVQ